jgi:protocatechuate 3,4-dioxygenase beta subunit
MAHTAGMDHDGHPRGRRLTRRGSLLSLGGLVAGTLGVAVGKDRGLGTADATAAGVGPAGVASGAVSCVLTPELTEGPYYIAGEKVRRNITEGKPGTPLLLKARVVDAATCAPIKNAAVDIWHADASGVYSGFGSGAASRTFMRGIQRTDPDGIATFQTVYPGWYMGRTVHIHVKVHVGGNVVHTGQLFFPDTLTDAVYRRSPYSRRPNRDVLNVDDAIFRNGGRKGLVTLRKRGSGYVGTITMGVHRS